MEKTNKGFGDTIDSITTKTGIKGAIKKIFGDSCGCEERRKKMNALYPNFKNIRPFTDDEKKVFESIVPIIEKTNKLTPDQKNALNILHGGVFGRNAKWSGCGSCNQKTINNLKKVYEKSCDNK